MFFRFHVGLLALLAALLTTSLPTLVTLKQLAAHRGVSERTARNWAKAGYLNPLFRIKGRQVVVVDLDQANGKLDELVESGKVRPGYGTFGGQAVRPIVTEVHQ